MRGTLYNEKTKQMIFKLRSEGKTYSDIQQIIKIPKSTLSCWLGKKFPGVFTREKQLIHLKNARILAHEAVKKRIEKENQRIYLKIKDELKRYPLDNIGFYKAILSALYWAEGAKYKGVSGLKFANTDPKLSKLFISLLRKCYKVDENKFRIKLYLHHYHKVKEVKNFWSKLLKISEDKFNKTYRKHRNNHKRFRKNFMGICFITYLDSSVRKEIMELAYQIEQIFE